MLVACHVAPSQCGIGRALTACQHAATGEAIHARVVATACHTCIAEHVAIRVLLYDPWACILLIIYQAALVGRACNVDTGCIHAHAVRLVVGVCLAKHASLQ